MPEDQKSINNEMIRGISFASTTEGIVKVLEVFPGPSLTVIFFPPDPTVVINNNPNTALAYIKLGYDGETSGKQININRLGQIEITSY